MLQTVMLAMVLLVPTWIDEDEVPVVKPDKVKDYLDKKVTIEFEVKSTHFSERSQTTFLNSESNFRDEKNFQVVIFKDGLERFQAVDIKKPADHFKGKKIRVTGRVKKAKESKDYKNRFEVKVIEPSSIKIVSSGSEDKPSDDKPGKDEKPSAKPPKSDDSKLPPAGSKE